jgi:hypothetical protein
VRHELIPLLETYNPNFRHAARRMAEVVARRFRAIAAAGGAEAWPAVVRSETAQAIVYDLTALRQLPLGLQRSLLREGIHRLRFSLRDIDWQHVEDALRVIRSARVGARAVLPRGLALTLGYDEATLAAEGYEPPLTEERPRLMDGALSVPVPGTLPLPDTAWQLTTRVVERDALAERWRNNPDPYTAYLDFARHPGPAGSARAARGGLVPAVGAATQAAPERFHDQCQGSPARARHAALAGGGRRHRVGGGLADRLALCHHPADAPGVGCPDGEVYPMSEALPVVRLKRGRYKSVLNRHPWIFSGSISSVHGSPVPGAVVDVHDQEGGFLARGYYNPHSQITVRILTWNESEPIDRDFWRRRLQASIARRGPLLESTETTAYRLAFAESDGLPGLIVDRYGEWVVLQSLTYGIEPWKTTLADLLVELTHARGVYERSDVDVRAQERLESVTGDLAGERVAERVIVSENGLRFQVDIAGRAQDRLLPGSARQPPQDRALLRRQAGAERVFVHGRVCRVCRPRRGRRRHQCG